MPKLTSVYLFLFAHLFVGFVSGCSQGPSAGTVSGNVTFDGKPYDKGALIFLDMESGQAASVDIQPGGQFALAEPLPIGTYNIYLAPKSVEDLDAPPQAVSVDSSIPSKYWNEATTDIIQAVQEGENSIVVALQK